MFCQIEIMGGGLCSEVDVVKIMVIMKTCILSQNR